MGNKTPSKKVMADPENAQRGEPSYMDVRAQSVSQHGHDVNLDTPSYKTQNVRYWEYR